MFRVDDRILWASAIATRVLIGVAAAVFCILGSAKGQTTNEAPLAALGLVDGQNSEVAWTLDPASIDKKTTVSCCLNVPPDLFPTSVADGDSDSPPSAHSSSGST